MGEEIIKDGIKTVKVKKGKINKAAINIIRTTMRNNIELTAIADNKASVMLSLNGIMLTFLIPLALSNRGIIEARHLALPLLILFATCFITIFISAMVLKPSNFKDYKKTSVAKNSPFFFMNFYERSPSEFVDQMNSAFTSEKHIKAALAEDLFFMGKRLTFKLNWIRISFNIFLIGVGLTLVSTIVMLFLSK